MDIPKDENEMAVSVAATQAPRDMIMTPVEVTHAALYKLIVDDPKAPIVPAPRWYVELELLNLNDNTTTAALYRVWRAENGVMKAVQVELLGGKLRKEHEASWLKEFPK